MANNEREKSFLNKGEAARHEREKKNIGNNRKQFILFVEEFNTERFLLFQDISRFGIKFFIILVHNRFRYTIHEELLNRSIAFSHTALNMCCNNVIKISLATKHIPINHDKV